MPATDPAPVDPGGRASPGVTDPAPAGELAGLRAFLRRQRELVAWKLAGIDADTLQSAVTPSGTTALGIVRHLGEVERSWWFDDVLGVEGTPLPARPDAGVSGATVAEVLADYAETCRTCDDAIVGLPLDRLGAREPVSVRWVYLHLIEETARHLGQLDLLREQADGAVGEDPLP